jgi:transposase
MEFKRISIDTSKHVFTIHGVDDQERPLLRREIRRAQVEPFFAKLAPTEVVLEACAGSHHWGRVLGGMGHRVRLIPPQYVKPFVKRSKNDRNDAEAICEAASRPAMRQVPVKSVDEQAATIAVKHRELLVNQRTQAINALRGHAAEFGIVAAKGCANVTALLALLSAEEAIPAIAKAMFEQMGRHITDLDAKIEVLEKQLLEQHKTNAVSRLLAAIPGVGPITAITMALSVNPANFETGRHFAAWIGLTPREYSTGGKHRLGRISKAGSERLRQLLVVGAMAVIRFAKPGSKSATAWLLQLLERRPRRVAAVALANKMARIIWAELAEAPAIRRIVGEPAKGMMARGEAYRRQPIAA